MKGFIHGNEARMEVEVFGPSGRRVSLEAVIDTGSSGWLTLPQSLIDVLDLPRKANVRAILANGVEAVFDTYEAGIVWNRRDVLIEIELANAMPMVGMSLEAWRGGEVKITPRCRRR